MAADVVRPRIALLHYLGATFLFREIVRIRSRCIPLLSLDTGMRAGQVRALRLRDFD